MVYGLTQAWVLIIQTPTKMQEPLPGDLGLLIMAELIKTVLTIPGIQHQAGALIQTPVRPVHRQVAVLEAVVAVLVEEVEVAAVVVPAAEDFKYST